jgi:hypothetical protein
VRALPYAGVFLLWAATVAGVWFALEQALEIDNARIESTRTPVPGQRIVELDTRRYNIFFEADNIVDPDQVGQQLDDPATSPLRIRIREEDSDRVLPLDGYSGTLTLSGGPDATAIATVRIPREGRYRITVTSTEDLFFSSPSITLGEPIARRVVKLVGGLIVAGVTLLAGLLILVVTLILRAREPGRAEPDHA